LHEETSLTIPVDELLLLSGNLIRVPLHAGKCRLVCVFSTCAHVPYVTANLRTMDKVEHAVTVQSTTHLDGS
jgi:hypothetical protein